MGLNRLPCTRLYYKMLRKLFSICFGGDFRDSCLRGKQNLVLNHHPTRPHRMSGVGLISMFPLLGFNMLQRPSVTYKPFLYRNLHINRTISLTKFEKKLTNTYCFEN